MTPLPLVSCIMPTSNRRAFVPRAIGYFLRQDYPHKELVIVDDGDDPVEDLAPADERVCYMRLPARATMGAKRNLACEHAHGEIIAHWDDDDWHAPHRLSYQVAALLRAAADIGGINRLLFYDQRDGRAWRYVYPSRWAPWLSGSTLCYTRAFWSANRFAHINVGEDSRFIAAARPERMVVLPDSSFHVGMIHGRNVSPKHTSGVCWQPYPAEEIRRLLGDDWAAYQPGAAAGAAPPAAQTAPAVTQAHCTPVAERSVPMLTVARADDLQMPEFAAFNHSHSLPWMRRWELPFALFHARLDTTSAVLDCTITPVSFAERVARLYPHVLYRHHSPIQGQSFVLPADLPDGAFDCVFCINTLEHLLRPQREALIGALAHKLRPGGRLVLTCDYYFDSAWSQPYLLQLGLVRADRQEVFNGFNKVTPQEWLELCGRFGLEPLGEPPAEPQEGDPALYLQQPPYVHACIGGVFGKPPLRESGAARKLVLALLTWNTREVSLESVQAYAREARMLQRLGHRPLLVVCDNGSTDGTREALRALEPELDVPHHFVLNPQNRGNSVARNQIIGVMREAGADYLLFMDGDIEVVPFSSFAMLRYLENTARHVGCIGAYYADQTPDRERAAPYLYSVEGQPVSTSNLVAWTQYGMFRRAVFDDGVRFDEHEPFDRPGWGFEDNDLAFQMDVHGYLNRSFSGMRYLHRAVRSSVRNLREQGIDPDALCARRQRYVIDKWSTVPQISRGPLDTLRRMALRI